MSKNLIVLFMAFFILIIIVSNNSLYAQDSIVLDYMIGENGFEKGLSKIEFKQIVAEENILSPCWSSDGKKIAYLRTEKKDNLTYFLTCVTPDGINKIEIPLEYHLGFNSYCFIEPNSSADNSFLVCIDNEFAKTVSIKSWQNWDINDIEYLTRSMRRPIHYAFWNKKYATLLDEKFQFLNGDSYKIPYSMNIGSQGAFFVSDFRFFGNSKNQIMVFLSQSNDLIYQNENNCGLGICDLPTGEIKPLFWEATKGCNLMGGISLYRNRFVIFKKTGNTVYYIMDINTGTAKKLLDGVSAIICNENGEILFVTHKGLSLGILSNLTASEIRAKAEHFVSTNKLEDAIGEYDKIVQNYPTSEDSVNAVKQIELLKAQIADRKQNEAVVKVGKLMELAKTLSASKDYEKSIETAKEVLKMAPDNKEAVLLISDCSAKIEEREKSAKENQANLLIQQAGNFLETKQFQNALQSVNQALALLPDSESAIELLAKIEVEIAKQKNAEIEQEKLQKRREAKKHYLLAMEHKKAGNLKQAFEEVNESLKKDVLFEDAAKLLDEICKTGIQIVVKGTDGLAFSGSYGDSSGSVSIDGSCPTRIFVNKTDVVSISFQKQIETGSLTVEIIKDGVSLNSKSTDAKYGIITLTQKIK